MRDDQPTKPTLTADDPIGWYECRYVFESPDDRVARYWDGERLRLNPRNSSWYGLEAYADFRRLVYAEPTPQPGVAELVAALRWAHNELNHQTDESGCCYQRCAACKSIRANPTWRKWANDGHNPVDAALAAVEAAEQERGE